MSGSGLVDDAAIHGPQAAQDAEHTRLPAPVGADHEEVVASLEVEGECLHKHVTIG